jgi:hypothetical protein
MIRGEGREMQDPEEGNEAGGDEESVSGDECAPRLDEDHGEILRLLIGEGTEATLEMFHEAKAPDIDPNLKLKLITLGSRLGDNVRKAIATHARHFRRRGLNDGHACSQPRADERSTALRRAYPRRHTVPISRDFRQVALPDARRQGVGSA